MSDSPQTPAAAAPPLTHSAEVARWLAAREGDRLGVDIEGDGMFRYRASLCTVQLADRERTCVVDTLEVDAAETLGAVLGDPRVEKVVHDASFDARMLHEAGAPLRGLFDTAIAARFLSYPATGLSALLERHFGVRLDKEPQQADWGKRPLDAAALGYLHADVRYLLPLADALEQALEQAGIVEEFRVECDYVLAQAQAAEPDARPLWARVKGAGGLRGQGWAVLRELAELRERLAEQRDVPPGRLLPAGLLIALSTRRPQSPAQLDKLLRRTRLGADEKRQVLDAIERGLSAGEVPAEELSRAVPPPPSPEERALHKRRRAALSSFRSTEAERRGVDPQAVLPGHCLKDLVALREATPEAIAAVPGLGACRVERYAADLLAALEGAAEPAG